MDEWVDDVESHKADKHITLTCLLIQQGKDHTY